MGNISMQNLRKVFRTHRLCIFRGVDLIKEGMIWLVIAIQSIFGLTRGCRGVKQEGMLHLGMALC
jgi:hypothetical protein